MRRMHERLGSGETIVDPGKFERLKESLAQRRAENAAKAKPALEAIQVESRVRSETVAVLDQVPAAPDLDRHVLRNTPIEQIWKFINPLMLYGRHSGFRVDCARA